MSVLLAIKSFLGFKGVAETGLRILEKVTGTDFTDADRAKFILDYHNARKHESPTRRLIAIMMLLGLMIFGLAYGVIGGIASLYVFMSTEGVTLAEITASQNLAEITVKPLLQWKNDIYIFMKEIFVNPMSIVIGFYFLTSFQKK